ncbi:MAG: right-handed parallel beta-helix repeat-containing protein [Pirellulaceae bacterium]|nr:right-handed parallel beta-helix repeat-containing protein [Pirellulaceae bacterium]
MKMQCVDFSADFVRPRLFLTIFCLVVGACDNRERPVTPSTSQSDTPQQIPSHVTATASLSQESQPGSEVGNHANSIAEESVYKRTHYVTRTGNGRSDGSDWQNAAPAESLQGYLSEDVSAGDRIMIGSGTYSRFSVTRGGSADQPVSITGVDTGNGLPSIQGRWKQANPKYHAHSWNAISLADGLSHLRIGGLEISGFIYGVQATNNHHVELSGLSITRCREAVLLRGLTDSAIRDCQFIRYTKRGIRFKEGCHDLVITDVVADATGGDTAWPTEAFPFGFAIENGDGNHSIRYERCTARNNIFPSEPGKYWNGDGFLAENNSSNLVYIDCSSFGNSDGGWDDKSLAPSLVGCIAARNKRGFRFWNVRGDREHPARLENCLGVYNKSAGGSGSSAGLWTCGAVEAERCTFHNNATAAVAIENNRPGGKLLAINCILSADTTTSKNSLVLKENGTTYDARSVITFNGDDPDDDPQYKDPSSDWNGSPIDAFVSRKYGTTHGYRLDR